jgi:RNA polymerase sigma factor (sigma-70 family)
MNEHSNVPGSEESRWEAMEDSDLLRLYNDRGSEPAFAELVRRRIGLVYSVALRQSNGDRHRAEDVTQSVFVDLARKAGALAGRPVIAGWLYRSARFAAAGLVRSEQRRHAREHSAHAIDTLLMDAATTPDWEKLRPVLDDVLSEIDEGDRDAVLLRFFDARSFADIGQRLRLTENAARMRVLRALDKLNAALAKRGITSTASALGAAVAQQASAAMPSGLAASITTAVLSNVGVAGSVAVFAGLSKLQIGIAGALAAAGVAGFVVQESKQSMLRAEIAALQNSQYTATALRAENERLGALTAEADLLRRDDLELRQLAKTIENAREASAAKNRLAQLNESRLATEKNARDEIERMNREGNALVGEYKALSARAKDAALNEHERARSDADAKLKLAAIQAKQREIQTFIASVRASDPTFDPKARSVLAKSDAEKIVYYPGTAYQYSATPQGEQVSFRLSTVDCPTALSALETMSGRKVVRDASLAHVSGTLNLQAGISSKDNALQALRSALKEQLNVVIESMPDGSMIAKLGATR